MSFSESFWQNYKNNQSEDNNELGNIKGYFTTIPIHWTEGENNLVPYNMRLIASNVNREGDDYQIANNYAIEEGLS